MGDNGPQHRWIYTPELARPLALHSKRQFGLTVADSQGNVMDLIEWIIGSVLTAFALLMAVLLLVYMPVMLKTEADCLRQGFPKYSVSVGLERYCLNMQGAVTTVVVPQK